MLTLEQSFNNVKIVCDNASMNKAERNAIDESLNNIAGALQAHELMLVAAKDKEPKELEDESDAKDD